jgi:hypothetical protein
MIEKVSFFMHLSAIEVMTSQTSNVRILVG